MDKIVQWLDSDRLGYVIDEDTGCHVWQGARTSKGYAQVSYDGRVEYVHRVRYEMEVGPIPDGLVLDHYVCDNGPGGCCNPDHCRPVTVRENVLRGDTIVAECAAKTHCPQGHEYTDDNIRQATFRRTGQRSCRTCHRLWNREYRRRQRARKDGAL